MPIAAALRPHAGIGQDQAHRTLSMGDQRHQPVAAPRGAGRPVDALPPPLDLRRRRHDPRRVPGARRGRGRCSPPSPSRPWSVPSPAGPGTGRADRAVSLTTGRGPLSARPAGRFTAPMPERVAYIEPFRRRVGATKDGATVIDSERVLLVHRPGRPPVYAFPVGDVDGPPARARARRTRVRHGRVGRRRRLVRGGRAGVRAPAQPVPPGGLPALGALAPGRGGRGDAGRHARHAGRLRDRPRTPPLRRPAPTCAWTCSERSETQTYCPYKGTATLLDAPTSATSDVDDVAWSYEDPLPESSPLGRFLSFDEAPCDRPARPPDAG